MTASKSAIQKRIDKIVAYNSKHNLTPLYFTRLGGTAIVPMDESRLRFNQDGSPNRKRLILEILRMTSNYCSHNGTTVETTPGRNRSSLDIWRHARYVYPDIDLFAIMEAIHKLCAYSLIYGQYCHQVKRAVFYISDSHTYMSFHCGEYKMSFNTWKNLHVTD